MSKLKEFTAELPPLNENSDGRKDGKFNKRKYSMAHKALNLDDVLVNELGQFGCFQLKNILLVAVPIMMSAFINEYIFSAAAIPHRCQIPECGENSKNDVYDQHWLGNALPGTDGNWASCERYAPISEASNGTINSCPANLFDKDKTEPCNGFVYSRNNSVVYEFDLGCNDWLRALAGTLSSLGTLLVLPLAGYISDRYGRRAALVINIFCHSLFGLFRAFSVNYPMYLTLQLLQTTFGGGIFSSAYIFATELVGPKYRVVTSATCSSLFALGQVVLGTVAWLVQPWRYMIMTLYVPSFFIVFYYWILSESVRWLLSKRRFHEAKKVLENVARCNKKQISEKSLNALMNPPPAPAVSNDKFILLKSIFNSKILCRRVYTTPVWWITTTFVYYGLSINSTGLSDQMYLNYILICAIEIPGFFTSVLVLDKFGRRITLSCGYLLSAACNITLAFVAKDLQVVRLILFLIGKFSISVVFTSLYLFTSELYPTEYRHTLLAFSSMIGRIGSIVAPLTPALMTYWDGTPSVMFGAMGLLSGLLVLTQPETKGQKMPDTLAEAEVIGLQ